MLGMLAWILSALRAARVLAVFEGTTGIQALDLVHRRLRLGDGLAAFLHVARSGDNDAGLHVCLDFLENARAVPFHNEAIAGATALAGFDAVRA
jgi:hypothetical protein